MKKTFISIVIAILFLSTGASAQNDSREVTIIYTNDFHSAFDPIPAYWLKGSPRLGGAAQLTTLANQIRARRKTTFFFDTGDMFTGQLSFLTKGEALMEMMRAMNYDAMVIGNHEFDYGADNFERQMNRVDFPVLGANIFYKDTNNPYSRPYTIIEKDGLRVGVIGVIGQDARSVALPSGITNLDFADPIPVVRRWVAELRPQVDLVVVLAHQGKTGPMQTDAENRPEVQRDFDEDIRLTTEVEGIDVFVGGHAHRGIETPFVNPKTGTLIVQTYGYGTRLGYLNLQVKNGKVVSHKGELLKVWSDRLVPDARVAKVVEKYKKLAAPSIGIVLGRLKTRLVRDYNRESSLGNFVADVIREYGQADVGIENAGGLRADLPEGAVTNGNVYDALPFVNTVTVCELTGTQLREVIEQGLSLERGMVQVSGMKVTYDLSNPIGHRMVNAEVGGRPLDERMVYQVAVTSFLAEGGDLYTTFLKTKQSDKGGLISEVLMDYIKRKKIVESPIGGRLIPVNKR